MYKADFKVQTPLHKFVHACRSLVLILCAVSLAGCVTTGSYKMAKACAGREYCPERDGPRQYVRAPDGWGGKYCLQNPTEC